MFFSWFTCTSRIFCSDLSQSGFLYTYFHWWLFTLHLGLLSSSQFNEVLNNFLAFKTHVEQKSRKSIKFLRMDNESKYVNRRSKYFCRLEGIDLQNLPTFNSHKIDVATLRIQTLKSMASFMIQAKSLDPTL